MRRIAAPGTEAPLRLLSVCGPMHVVVHCVAVPGTGPRVDSEGHFPHLRYEVQGGRAAELFEGLNVERHVSGDAERLVVVDFNCGSHYLPAEGNLYLRGGSVNGEWDIAVFRRPIAEHRPHWRWLTARFAGGGGGYFVFPNYHTAVKTTAADSLGWTFNSDMPVSLGREPLDLGSGYLTGGPVGNHTLLTGVWL